MMEEIVLMFRVIIFISLNVSRSLYKDPLSSLCSFHFSIKYFISEFIFEAL